MLGCKGISRIPSLPICSRSCVALPPAFVSWGGCGHKQCLPSPSQNFRNGLLLIKCKDEGVQTVREVKPRRRRTKKVVAEESESDKTASPASAPAAKTASRASASAANESGAAAPATETASPVSTRTLAPDFAKTASPDSAKTASPTPPAAGPDLVLVENVPEAELSDASTGFLKPVSVTIPLGRGVIVVETGLIGRLANGAVTVTVGETVVYTTVCSAVNPTDPSDFIPLTVNYQERFSAAGRTSGGFIKREGRTKDHEILVCRLIDRPIRPLIATGFNFETQILSWVLSYDGIHSPEPLAITAAGAALALSDIPMAKPVAGVRVGMVDGEYIVNPTVQEMAVSTLDMVIAGTSEAVLTIEGYCSLLPEETLLEAVEVGQAAIAVICKELEKLAASVGKPVKLQGRTLPPPSLGKYIEDAFGGELEAALQIKSKKSRGQAITVVEKKLLRLLTRDGIREEQATVKVEDRLEELVWNEDEDGVLMLEDGEVDEGDIHVRPSTRNKITAPYDPIDVKLTLKEVCSKIMRSFIVKSGVRSDGRGIKDVRPIQAMCGLLPRVHGSALFTRGETQALAVTTLGGGDMAQRVDNLTSTEPTKRFYLQYAFPQSSVGETGRVGAPSRREIGHGTLAERALDYILPAIDEFPYNIRLETTITESNGSSSMASVCGGCLAMLDAGVPLTGSVAGVAMGLILDTKGCGGDGEPLILTDILGSEDALGDMDFKVAGNETSVTAFQMDMKVQGVTIPVLRKTLLQAREARVHILREMTKCSPPPARTLSKNTPFIDILKIRPEKVNVVIGSGGRTVKGLIEDTGVISIEVNNSGNVTICGRTTESVQMAKAKIAGLTMVPVVGTVYRNCLVKGILTFGCFVEIAPGKEGLVHISELDITRVNKVEDIVHLGDLLDVKLIEINVKGQLRLSRKQVLEADSPPPAKPPADSKKKNQDSTSDDPIKNVQDNIHNHHKQQSQDGMKDSSEEKSQDGMKDSLKEQSQDGLKDSPKEQSQDDAGVKDGLKKRSQDAKKDSSKEKRKQVLVGKMGG